MEKIIIFLAFIFLFIYLIRRDIVYVIPMIFLFYTNINGLLDWEDFAQHGSIKFPDYGFILSVIIIIYVIYFKRAKANRIFNSNNGLLLLIYFHILYYLFLFLYSVILQGSLEWPIKIGRTYFYGISIIVFYLLLVTDPVEKYKKVFSFFKIYTIVFSIMYIVYNHFNINFYANKAYEIIDTDYGVVNRNFAAFPYFLMYFYCISLVDFLNRKGNYLINLLLIILYLICMVSDLTRGTIISAGIIFIVAYIISDNRKVNTFFILFFFGIGFFVLKSIHYFETGSFLTLLGRFSEFGDVGIASTANFEYRIKEFLNIYNNVIQFNPLFGFGFVNTSILGFHFNIISAGSPDNGFTNLLGTTGFIGISIFFIIIMKWVLINVKLQRFVSDDYSKAHFLYIIAIFLSFMNSSGNSYIESFGVFLIYDLLIYRLNLKHIKLSNSIIVPSG
jgi:hypothetical protein